VGLFFLRGIPAASLWQLLRCRRPYIDNWFEVQARERSGHCHREVKTITHLARLFVPIAIVLRFLPGAENPRRFSFARPSGIIPLAGWMGRATEALAREWAKEPADY